MRILTAIFCLFFSVSQAKSPAWTKTVKSQKLGPYKNLKPIQFTYSLSWKGLLRAGQTTFEFGATDPKNKNNFIAKSYGRSLGFARTLYPYQHVFYGVINKRTWQPSYFKAWERDGDESKTTIVTYSNNQARCREIKKDETTGKILKDRRHQYQFKPLYDIMSAMMFFRSQRLKKGDTYNVVIHPGNSPYLVTGTVSGYDNHKNYHCAKLELKLQKIGPDMELLKYKKLQKATFWISLDNDRIPVELRTKIFIGDVRATMISKKYL